MKGVTESCVVGIKAPNENDEIPLIFIVKNIHNLSEEVILQCANQFAYKKIQKAYFMDSLPKTMAGEILKRKLREIAATKYNTFQRD
jgi:long-chain acyl-CoA synthetase